MKRISLVTLILLGLALAGLNGCGSDSNKDPADLKADDQASDPDNAPADVKDPDQVTPSDVAQDLAVDVADVQDTTPVEDTAKPDVVEDTAKPDETNPPDEIEDNTQPDVVEDVEVVEDVVDPNSCGYGDNIAGLLNCAEGPVDVKIVGGLVTYAFDKGFFVYDDSSEHGMEFYLPTMEFTAPAAGDVIECHVLEWGNYLGQQEVTKVESCTIIGSGDPTEFAIELVAANVVPSESIESRLVYGNGLTVVQITDKDAVVAYGNQATIALRLDTPGELCVGATFNLLRGVITQYDQIHRIQVFVSATDLQSINTTNCGAAPTFDDSNWGFEEAGFDNPPADFLNAGTFMTSNRDTTAFYAGVASCKLGWTSTTNQDFVQGYYAPAVEGQKATLTVQVLDNSVSGRARLGIAFFKADKTGAGSAVYAADYTVDGANWQLLTLEATAPVDAAYVRGLIRLYDDGAGWTGSAIINIDDWNLTVQ